MPKMKFNTYPDKLKYKLNLSFLAAAAAPKRWFLRNGSKQPKRSLPQTSGETDSGGKELPVMLCVGTNYSDFA